MKKEIDYLNVKKRLRFKQGMTYRDMFLSTSYIRFWTFIHKYGERFHFDKELNNATKPFKGEMGKCISNSLETCKAFNKILDEREIKHYRTHYAEGLSSEHPLSLHAWNVRVNSRHAKVLDYTWDTDADDVWYQGVIFDTDFYREINKRQYKENFKNTLPYLSSGACCLTYKPLVYGELAEYPVVESDIDEAMETLDKFILGYVIKG